MFTSLGARLLPQSNLSEGADRVGGQLRGDKECPFRGVTKSGRVWRKVPESDARSVTLTVSVEKERVCPRVSLAKVRHPTASDGWRPGGANIFFKCDLD